MPRPRSISNELAGAIKLELVTRPLPEVCAIYPHVPRGVVQAIKYGNAYADLEPVGPVRGVAARTKPTPQAKAFHYGRTDNVPKVLRREEREAYEAALERQRADDELAAAQARVVMATEHLRRPYLVQISVVVGLEAVDEGESLLAIAAEFAARQVLGMRARNRGWAVDAIERVR